MGESCVVALALVALGVVYAAGFDELVCNAGSYSSKGRCVLCPGGTFGARPGLTTPQCSGKCSGGFFCPPGSTSATQKPCGAKAVSTYYCPPGSAERQRVTEGFYTAIWSTNGSEELKIYRLDQQTRCEAGYYCTFGIRRPCPAGTYGWWPELTTAACHGPCPKGYYCPKGTANPIPCPAGTFGNDLGLATPSCSGICPLGRYWFSNSEAGTVTPQLCPPGYIGNSTGLTTQECSRKCTKMSTSDPLVCKPSLCPAGFYCPAGATAPIPCGNVGVYCPEGSSASITVSSGYYTIWATVEGEALHVEAALPPDSGVTLLESLADQYIDGGVLAIQRVTTRSSQRPCEPGSYCVGGVKKQCPPGVYGATQSLSTAACTAPCPAGYYCPIGTIDYMLYPCTARDSYCRIGSSLPLPVNAGYYTVTVSSSSLSDALSLLRVDQTICPLGSFCVNGVSHLCPPGTFGATTGLQTRACSGRCQPGYTCPLGSVSATQSPCPAGTYSLPSGVSCAPCAPGFWCGQASPTREQNACGSDTSFCPLGSVQASPVSDGFFATGQLVTTHTSQQRCIPRNAVHIPQCPTRTVGSNAGL